MPPRTMESVSAMCFLELQDVLVCAFSSGRLEMWQQLKLLYSNKLSDSRITALCSMPDEQLAVGCGDSTVSVWKLKKDSQQCIAGLSKVHSYTLKSSAVFLHYCTTLLAVSLDSIIINVFSNAKGEHQNMWNLYRRTHVLCIEGSGEHGLWLVAEEHNKPVLAHLHTRCSEEKSEKGGRKRRRRGKGKEESEELLQLDTNASLKSGFDQTQEEEEQVHHHHHHHHQGEKHESREYNITAAALHNDLIVCGDSKGHMWFNETPTLSSWTPRRRVHSDRISALRLTESIIISASYDRTIKLWDRKTKKQLGLFVCDTPVEVLQVNPNDPSQIVCGDTLGQIYFLSWKG